MKGKRVLASVLAAGMTMSLLAGCGSGSGSSSSGSASSSGSSAAATETAGDASAEGEDFSGQTIEVDVGGEMDQVSMDLFKEMTQTFADSVGATIDVVTNGEDHDQVMRTKMASNSVPDIWSTHGWSVARYNDFLMDLSDQDWVSNMDDAIAAVVTDENGKVCTMPMTEWIYGYIYNKDVLDANGIDPAEIKSWDDFFAVCDQLKAAGVTPIGYHDKTTGVLASYLEMMSAWYTIDGAPYASNEELKAGTFDFTQHTECMETFATIWDEEYLNQDVFTNDQDTWIRNLGNGTYAFAIWGSPQYLNTMQEYYPDGNYGIMPVPAVKEGGNASYTVGEGVALGISATTEHEALCKAYLQYMHDNLATFIKTNGNLPGFQGIDVPENKSIQIYKDSVAAAGENITYCNFFDREYLPSGMWNIMEEAMVSLYNGGDTAAGQVAAASQIMQDNYLTLFSAN